MSKIKPKGYWTKDICHQEALKYRTRMEFKNGSMAAYVQAVKRGFLNDICEHMDVIGNLKLRHLYVFEFEDNHFYVGLSIDPKKRYSGHMANRFNRISPVLKHINETNANFIYKIITQHPLDVITAGEKEKELIKFYCNTGWVKLNKTNGGEFGGNKINHTKKSIHNEALRYSRRSDFKKGSSGAYKIACKNGWMDEVCSHMLKPMESTIKWDKEKLIRRGSSYPNITSFRKADEYAYKLTRLNGWLSEIVFK
jgi:hypothetical protein